MKKNEKYQNEKYQEEELDAWDKIKCKSLDEVMDLLENKNEATRYAAARELHMRGEQEAFERAETLCRSSNTENRSIAAFVLGQLGVKNGHPFKAKSVPVLKELLLHDPSGDVRAAAISALGFLNATSVYDSVAELAADSDSNVRSSVAFTLGLLGKQEAVAVLEVLTNDEDKEVADMAKNSIEILKEE